MIFLWIKTQLIFYKCSFILNKPEYSLGRVAWLASSQKIFFLNTLLISSLPKSVRSLSETNSAKCPASPQEKFHVTATMHKTTNISYITEWERHVQNFFFYLQLFCVDCIPMRIYSDCKWKKNWSQMRINANRDDGCMLCRGKRLLMELW